VFRAGEEAGYPPGGTRSPNGAQFRSYKQNNDIILPQFAIQRLFEATARAAYITTEVGQHQMWAAQFFASRNRTAG
jgi:thiamine pyrophosphate-dependent acetolactate synthase large subunit-like protein